MAVWNTVVCGCASLMEAIFFLVATTTLTPLDVLSRLVFAQRGYQIYFLRLGPGLVWLATGACYVCVRLILSHYIAHTI